jgi:hypothetical protein
MKKYLIALSIILSSFSVSVAQNIQLHYDFGRNLYPDQEDGRQKVTVTLEQFKADEWGSWYYFVDLDLTSKFFRSAYTEISREFKLGKETPFAAHIEYDGGLGRDDIRSFQHAALLGGAYNGHNDDFSKTWSVQLLYKRFFKSYDYTWAYNSFQLTGVWGLTFANKKCTFSGFIDLWRAENSHPDHYGHGMLVVLSEPQFWYNATEHLSIGTEVEFSNNFIYNTYDDQTFFINPTIALKWNL